METDGFLSSFARGAILPLRGAQFVIAHPRLWPLVIVPLILNLVVFVSLLIWAFPNATGYLGSWTADLRGWYVAPLRIFLAITFWLIVLVVLYLVYTPMALLIASPFNDRIAEHTERACNLTLASGKRFLPVALASEVAFSIWSEAKRLFITYSVLAALLLLNIVPLMGHAVYVVASLTWAAWSAAFEFTSYAGDRRRLGLRAKMNLLRRSPGASFGFGSVAIAILLIPFLNVLMVPILAAGGTMLFRLLEQDNEFHP